MTGHDHTDAPIEALRQPALPNEHAGEAQAVASMAGALPSAAAAGRGRPRKGVAILAVTVASLGAGGLAAAGPSANLIPGLDLFPPSFDHARLDDLDAAASEAATQAHIERLAGPANDAPGRSDTAAQLVAGDGIGPVTPTLDPTRAPEPADPAAADHDHGHDHGDQPDGPAIDDPHGCADGDRGAAPPTTVRGEPRSDCATTDAGEPADAPGGDADPAESAADEPADPGANAGETDDPAPNATPPESPEPPDDAEHDPPEPPETPDPPEPTESPEPPATPEPPEPTESSQPPEPDHPEPPNTPEPPDPPETPEPPDDPEPDPPEAPEPPQPPDMPGPPDRPDRPDPRGRVVPSESTDAHPSAGPSEDRAGRASAP